MNKLNYQNLNISEHPRHHSISHRDIHIHASTRHGKFIHGNSFHYLQIYIYLCNKKLCLFKIFVFVTYENKHDEDENCSVLE